MSKKWIFVTRKEFLSQENNPCQIKEFLSQEENSCQNKRILVTRKEFWSCGGKDKVYLESDALSLVFGYEKHSKVKSRIDEERERKLRLILLK